MFESLIIIIIIIIIITIITIIIIIIMIITMTMIMIIMIINKNSSFRRSTPLLGIRKYSAWSYIYLVKSN